MEENQKIEEAEIVKSPEEIFIDKYKKLCEEDGMQIIITPRWILNEKKQYEMSLEMGVGKIN